MGILFQNMHIYLEIYLAPFFQNNKFNKKKQHLCFCNILSSLALGVRNIFKYSFETDDFVNHEHKNNTTNKIKKTTNLTKKYCNIKSKKRQDIARI